MIIDHGSVGASTTRVFTWTERDALLYALGVGADASTLQYVTENSHGVDQRVLPTYGVIACDASAALDLIGEVDLGQVVHGAQSMRLLKALPPAGSVEITARVSSIADRGPGKSAIVRLAAQAREASTGDVLVETDSTVVVRNSGGFGGDPGSPPESVDFPDRSPDVEVTQSTSPNQALLYRLSGDRNPLHSDPWFARDNAGFPGPLLHGLCTWGFAGRALLREFCDNDDTRFTDITARFTSPVFPGDTLTTQAWLIDTGGVVFRTIARGDGDGIVRVALDGGRLSFSSG